MSEAKSNRDGVVLFVALPVYGGYHPHFVDGLLELVTHRPCPMIVKPLVGDSLVARARNRLAAQFLAHPKQPTHLIFLDTDLIFSADQVARLVDHAAAGVEIVAGLYPKKQKELGWVCNVEDPEDGEPGEREDGLVRVKYAGTGCLMISRGVLERMVARFGPEIWYQPDDGESGLDMMWDFFSVGVWVCPKTGRRRYLSEDWYFCERARQLGIPTLMDTRVVLKHCGEAIYPLQEVGEFAEMVSEE